MWLFLEKVLLAPFARVEDTYWAHNLIGGIKSSIHKSLVVWALGVWDTQAPLDGIHSWIGFNISLHVVSCCGWCIAALSDVSNAHSHWSIGFALSANPGCGFLSLWLHCIPPITPPQKGSGAKTHHCRKKSNAPNPSPVSEASHHALQWG